MQESRTKDETFLKILEAVIRLECTHGHMRWKLTDLSRASRVTRTLIYYYFGKSKPALVKAAIDIVGQEFFGISPEREVYRKEGKTIESIRISREMIRKAPYVGIFYLTQRQPQATFYKEMMELERRYLKQLSTHNPNASPEQIQLLFASLFGVVILSDLSDQVLFELDALDIGQNRKSQSSLKSPQ